MNKLVKITLLFACIAHAYAGSTDYSFELLKAAYRGDITTAIEALNNGANLEVRDASLNATPLAWAAYNGNTRIVALLIQKGAYLEAQESTGLTPLHNAALKGYTQIVDLLLKAGANKNALTLDYSTPMHLAAEKKHKAVIKMLIESGADTKLKNREGLTVLDIARINRDSQLVQLLLGNSSDQTDQEEKINFDDIEGIRVKLANLQLPADTLKQVNDKLDILEKSPGQSHEATDIKKYMQWVFNLPWNKTTKDSLNIEQAKAILDEDHAGLAEIKERILDFMAIRQLKSDGHSPIICLVGPPGVGKTSLVKSIARALGRKYTRISLGGMRDEAELKGHQSTYIGSMPGQIIQSLKKVGTKNPVILLDEIDKLATGNFYGDPSAVLLEILDPNQNKTFYDNYLAFTFDVSNVMFIATANSLESIPLPLRDRMEIIQLAGYTVEEKVAIAEKYLVKKAKQETGLEDKPLSFSTDLLRYIVINYTHESGVRELERLIKKLCSKAARTLLEENSLLAFTTQNIAQYLGQPVRQDTDIYNVNQVGVTNGLAWTSVGGEVLKVEALLMPGTGKLILTGSLGKVMRESTKAALSYIRAHAREFNIDPAVFTHNDLHIHVPCGGIPKDGPSAGVALMSSILSVLTNRPTDSSYAMTGEINLRGNVMPIGGLKEKILAAKRNKIAHVIAPRQNQSDIADQPEVTKDIDIIWVDHINQVISKILLS